MLNVYVYKNYSFIIEISHNPGKVVSLVKVIIGFPTPMVDDTEIGLRGGEADAFPTIRLRAALRYNLFSTTLEPTKIGCPLASVPPNCMIHLA